MDDRELRPWYIFAAILCVIASVITGVFIASEIRDVNKNKTSEKPTVKVYVQDNDGDDSTLIYSKVINQRGDKDYYQFQKINGDKLEVYDLENIIPTKDETPYVTYKTYACGTICHRKGDQYGDATLHLPEGMYAKTQTETGYN